MLDAIYEWVIGSPERMMNIGASVMVACGALLFAACFGSILMVSQSIIHKGPISLADVLTGVPTWFVPESPGAVIFVLCLAGGGFFLFLSGQKLKRLIDRS